MSSDRSNNCLRHATGSNNDLAPFSIATPASVTALNTDSMVPPTGELAFIHVQHNYSFANQNNAQTNDLRVISTRTYHPSLSRSKSSVFASTLEHSSQRSFAGVMVSAD